MLINGRHLRKRNEKRTRNIVGNQTEQDLISIPVETYCYETFEGSITVLSSCDPEPCSFKYFLLAPPSA